MTILNRLASNWSRVEREKLNTNWSIIENYLSNLQGQINLLTGDVNVQELIDELNRLLNDGTIILSELETVLNNATEIITDAQNATENANDATQSALDAINDIQSMIDNFGVKGIYDNDTIYSKNNSVYHEGSSYIYTNNTASKGNPPPNYPTVSNAYWQMTAAKGASGNGAVSKVNDKEPDGAGEVILTASDVGAASAEQLEQLEQTTENHIGDNTKHLQPGQSDKINNSWQKDTYNNSRIINFGTKKAIKTFTVNQADWKNTGNVEQLGIVIPFKGAFSGFIKVNYSVMWGESESWGSTNVVYNIGSFVPQTQLNEFTILTASSTMMRDFRIVQPFIDSATGDLAILVFRAPTANNPLEITVDLDGNYSSSTHSSNLFNTLKNSYITTTDLGSPTAGDYPWTPQKDLNQRITENFTLFGDKNVKIASAISDKGVPTSADATGDQMAANIRAIQTQISVKGEIPLSPIPSNGLLEVYTPWFDFQPMYFSSTLPGMSLYGGYSTAQISTATNAFYILSLDANNQVVNGVSQWRLKLLIKNAYAFTSTQNKMDYFISK